jgi:hypothetical protein
MKELHGTASSAVAAPIERCFELLAAVEGYPSWYSDVVRDAAVLERDQEGRPVKARARLHVAAGPLVRDFDLLLAVSTVLPTLVRLARIPHDASDHEQFDVTWRLEDRGDTRIQLALDATLSVPRLLPIGGIGDSMADGFVRAAARALA